MPFERQYIDKTPLNANGHYDVVLCEIAKGRN